MGTQTIREFDYYLFDADGTLFDTTDLIVNCFEHTASHFGEAIPQREEIITNIGLTLRRQMELYFGPLDDEKFAGYQAEHISWQLGIYKNYLGLCPGVREALRTLRELDKKCAVVTSRRMETLSIYLRDTGIVDYFDLFITPESTKLHKPDPEPALEALRRLECDAPDRALFIGDSTFDIECGSRAATATAFVTWSRTPVESLSIRPDYLCNDMRELCQWKRSG